MFEKGRVVGKAKFTRKAGFLYFLDKQGNVREAKMNKGGKKGRRTCR